MTPDKEENENLNSAVNIKEQIIVNLILVMIS